MRTLVIDKDSVRVIDHRGYVDTEFFCNPGSNDRFEMGKTNRGFTVRWLSVMEPWGLISHAHFFRINAVSNYTTAEVIQLEVKE